MRTQTPMAQRANKHRALILRRAHCCVLRPICRVFFHFSVSYFILVFFFFFITPPLSFSFFFFFNDTATTEIYTLSLHDALPISLVPCRWRIPKLKSCYPDCRTRCN